MPRPKNGYRLKDGTQVPGTTDITNRYMDKQALITWANNEGLAGRRLYASRSKALDVGTAVHHMAELALKGRSHEQIMDYLGESLTNQTMRDQARLAYEAFDEWRSTFKVAAYRQEISLVSERHRYGGTIDIMATVGNELALIDLKSTSNGKVYADHLIQMAAYQKLWEENHPTEKITGGMHLILLPKTGKAFQHYYYPQLRKAWSVFVKYREAYELDQALVDPRMLAGVPVAERCARQFRRAEVPPSTVHPAISAWLARCAIPAS